MDDINTIPLEPRSDAGRATYWHKKWMKAECGLASMQSAMEYWEKKWLEVMETNSNLLKRINELEEQAAKYCVDDMFD